MPEKHPAWTRARVGRNRVRWVAYDDRPGSGEAEVVGEGYAASLPEADSAARSKLASLGMYQARRMSSSTRPAPTPRPDREPPERPTRKPNQARERPPEYLYSRRPGDPGSAPLIAAHRVLKKTPRRVHTTRRSIGPDQVGSEDERWDEVEASLALDRTKLDREGSATATGQRLVEFFKTREAAEGDAEPLGRDATRKLGLRPPFSVDDLKVAYRLKALDAHPDRGGSPEEFQAVEIAYRRLLREAQAPDA